MYKPTIGIEVHAELKTKSKMFCGCANDPHAAEANTHVCPVCMGEPGALPYINKEAVRKVLMVGVALDAKLADFTEFDRKQYFYPDLPKGYQISQYKYPLVSGGTLAGVDITRVHLEEDTARSQHEGHEGTLIDYNRSSVPLMELVTEPCIHDRETAGTFVRELQLLLKTIGVSDANLERGEMRIEANISVSKDDTLGTKVEVKNLNSFKSFESAIDYEIARHIKVLEDGGEIIQETRGWNEHKMKTFSQRTKEVAEEYRYFPDPDLPKLDLREIPEFSQSRIEEILPETPTKKVEKYTHLGLASSTAKTLVSQLDTARYADTLIEEGIDAETFTLAANYLTSDIQALRSENGKELDIQTASMFTRLMRMIADNKITSRVAKDLLADVVFDGLDPEKLAEERGLLQQNDTEKLAEIVRTIIADNPDVVADFKNGKETVLQYLVGQGMKATRGTANPKMLADILVAEIKNS